MLSRAAAVMCLVVVSALSGCSTIHDCYVPHPKVHGVTFGTGTTPTIVVHRHEDLRVAVAHADKVVDLGNRPRELLSPAKAALWKWTFTSDVLPGEDAAYLVQIGGWSHEPGCAEVTDEVLLRVGSQVGAHVILKHLYAADEPGDDRSPDRPWQYISFMRRTTAEERAQIERVYPTYTVLLQEYAKLRAQSAQTR